MILNILKSYKQYTAYRYLGHTRNSALIAAIEEYQFLAHNY